MNPKKPKIFGFWQKLIFNEAISFPYASAAIDRNKKIG
jgi:hypothetical protein